MSKKQTDEELNQKYAGKIFGQWTVIEFKERTNKKSLYFKCKCECGKEKFLDISSLRNGKTKSCPECFHKRHRLSEEEINKFIGEKIGSWTIIEFSHRNNKGIHYKCRCVCGVECIRTITLLKLNYVKEGKRCRNCKNIKSSYDLVGQTFGNWTISEFLSQNRSHKYFLCTCKCGNQSTVTLNALKRGYSTGCHECGVRRKYVHEIPGEYLSNIRFRAKKSNFEYNLDNEYLWELYEKQERQCALSGINICFRNRNNNNTASLDRIDSLKGYIKGNVQWLHKAVNIMKHDLPEYIFIHFCKLIASHHS